MFTIIGMAGATCAAALFTLGRVVGLKAIIKHATAVDVVFSIGAVIVLGGTMTGSLVAVTAGLMMACSLSVARWACQMPKAFQRAKIGVSGAVKARRQEPPLTSKPEADPLTVCTAPCVPDETPMQPNRGPRGPVLIMEAGRAVR